VDTASVGDGDTVGVGVVKSGGIVATAIVGSSLGFGMDCREASVTSGCVVGVMSFMATTAANVGKLFSGLD
jgi:hypothetical protein